MDANKIHFFYRNPAPNLMTPKRFHSTVGAPLRNQARMLRQIDLNNTFRFLKTDGNPIAKTDKFFPDIRKSPLRLGRNLIKTKALKMMQKHDGRKTERNTSV
ncbi:unnamed protein product [Blepharisma stoltei]|uniref:Uncharacterized protein n=1 Tax=Blepharisma stoltei TaxID=1481888 RepID=A0AAU9IIS8_9CILI|nr:unnamed protein product [Blepharisma stoltei]